MRRPKAKPQDGPERLGEVLSRLFVARGWARRSARLQLEEAWETAAGPTLARQSRVAGLRRGVLEVVVASSVLLQELTQFHHQRLLGAINRLLPHAPVTRLKFKVGPIESPAS